MLVWNSIKRPRTVYPAQWHVHLTSTRYCYSTFLRCSHRTAPHELWLTERDPAPLHRARAPVLRFIRVILGKNQDVVQCERDAVEWEDGKRLCDVVL